METEKPVTPAQQRVLDVLIKGGGSYSVETIAKRANMPRSTVQKALTALRNAGKVERSLEVPVYLWYA